MFFCFAKIHFGIGKERNMTDKEYKDAIQKLDKVALKTLWDLIENGTLSSNSTYAKWDKGKAFECLILRAFELDGAEVVYPFNVPSNHPEASKKTIEQIDGIVYYKHLACLVESKNYSEPIDFAPLAKMRSSLLRRHASVIGSCFSVKGFTDPAIILAGYIAPQTILLWEASEITYVLNKGSICESLVKKYHWYIERCIADYNTSK